MLFRSKGGSQRDSKPEIDFTHLAVAGSKVEEPCGKRCGQPLEAESSSQLTTSKELVSLRIARKQNLSNNLNEHRSEFLLRTSR